MAQSAKSMLMALTGGTSMPHRLIGGTQLLFRPRASVLAPSAALMRSFTQFRQQTFDAANANKSKAEQQGEHRPLAPLAIAVSETSPKLTWLYKNINSTITKGSVADTFFLGLVENSYRTDFLFNNNDPALTMMKCPGLPRLGLVPGPPPSGKDANTSKLRQIGFRGALALWQPKYLDFQRETARRSIHILCVALEHTRQELENLCDGVITQEKLLEKFPVPPMSSRDLVKYGREAIGYVPIEVLLESESHKKGGSGGEGGHGAASQQSIAHAAMTLLNEMPLSGEKKVVVRFERFMELAETAATVPYNAWPVQERRRLLNALEVRWLVQRKGAEAIINATGDPISVAAYRQALFADMDDFDFEDASGISAEAAS